MVNVGPLRSVVRALPDLTAQLLPDLSNDVPRSHADPRLSTRTPPWAVLTHDTWRDLTDQDLSFIQHHWKLGGPANPPQTHDAWQNHPYPYGMTPTRY